MQSIEIHVKQLDLADTLGAMREWLDRKRCNLSHFRHTSDAAGIVVIISVGFAAGDHACAEAFRQHFSAAG
jgi:hypothetical protein